MQVQILLTGMKSKKKWEYFKFTINEFDYESVLDSINIFGEDGWELVSIVKIRKDERKLIVHLFKKEID